MAGKKKQVKKASAKKAAVAKPAAKKAAAKKPAAAKKAAVAKPAARKASVAKPPARATKPPARATKKPGRAPSKGTGEVVEPQLDERNAAERLGKQWEQCWARIVAKTWVDPKFKKMLIESPERVLASEGLPMLSDVAIRLVPGGQGKFTMEIPLPDRPEDLDGEMIEDLIDDLLRPGGQRCNQSSCCC